MKKGVMPTLSASWWKANKSTLVKADPLASALKKYEDARTKFEAAASANKLDTPDLYVDAKTALIPGVLKAVEATIPTCNKTLHAGDIEGLNKYKSTVIPQERNELDAAYRAYEAGYERRVKAITEKRNATLAEAKKAGATSAQAVLDARRKAADLDKILSDALAAKRKGDVSSAKAHSADAVRNVADIAALRTEVAQAIAGVPKEWPTARGVANDTDRPALDKLDDLKFTADEQMKNNLATIDAIKKEAETTISEIRRVVQGSLDEAEVLTGAFDRFVSRMFSLVQENDVPARETKSARSNLEGDLDKYAKAKEAREKDVLKKQAVKNLKHAKTQLDALKKRIDATKSEFQSTLKSFPGSIVNKGNPAFTAKYNELDRAYKAMKQDEALHAKELQTLQKLGQQVAKLA
jgi:hypothetical protein